MNWQTKKIGEVCEKIELVSPARVYSVDFCYIDISSVDPTSKKIARVKSVPAGRASSRARKLVREGDTIFATTRPYLKNVALIERDLDGAIASTGFCVIRPKRKLLDPKFTFLVVSSESFVEKVIAKQKGATYPAVSDADIYEIEIPLPSLEIQKKIVKKIEELFAKIDQAKSLRHRQRPCCP
ncbi:MAG: restriction endonuclease subunit S [Candidatus Sungbacteria bacterium]|nr:restriction endonuclease subunit S [bacterium]MDZ4285313.1 restriction endonuclease subunit S [Candidatus Sungbacteria bacterium]